MHSGEFSVSLEQHRLSVIDAWRQNASQAHHVVQVDKFLQRQVLIANPLGLLHLPPGWSHTPTTSGASIAYAIIAGEHQEDGAHRDHRVLVAVWLRAFDLVVQDLKVRPQLLHVLLAEVAYLLHLLPPCTTTFDSQCIVQCCVISLHPQISASAVASVYCCVFVRADGIDRKIAKDAHLLIQLPEEALLRGVLLRLRSHYAE